MNAQFQVAQATGTAVPTTSTPVRTFSLAKPLTDQAVVVHLGYDQKVKLDFSSIANEKITLVHVGEKLIILFDNKSTITVDPVFDSRHDNQLLSIELAPGRDVSVQEFASLFPITTDQSVLPAAGDGSGNAQGSGANFSSSAVDPLNAGNPLDLLGQEELGNSATGDQQFPAISSPTVSVTGSIELVVDESFIPANGTNSAGSTTGASGSNVDTQNLQVVFTVSTPLGLQSLTYALHVDKTSTGLIDSLSGQGVVLVQKGTAEVDGVVTVNGKELTVFTLTVDGTGHITMTDLRGVHQDSKDNPADTSEGIHLGPGLVSVTATAVDVSGNSATGSFDLGPHITINDDGPSIAVAQGEGEGDGPHLPFLPALEVDESALPSGAQPHSLSTTATQDFSGAFTHVDGADGATITYALSVTAGGVDTHLLDSLTGHEVFLFNEKGTIVAREGTDATAAAGGHIVFTLEVDSSGQVTMTLERSVHEFTPQVNANSDEPISLSNVPVTLTATITDNDGDTASASISIGSTIVIHDDSPTIAVVLGQGGEEEPQLPVLPVLEVDESALPSGAQTPSYPASVTKDFSGLFTHADGADGATISYAVSVSGGGVDTHLIDSLTGHEVFLFNENGTIVARVGTDLATSDPDGAIAFTLKVDSLSGQVTMTLDRSVHELTPQANVPSNEPIQLSGVPVTLTATITDNDGDSASASIDIGSTIVIHDDSPTLILTPGKNSVTIDETPGQQAGTNDVQFTDLSAAAQTAFNNVANKGFDPDVSHDHNAIGYAVNSGLVSADINFGADGGDATQSKLFELTLAKSGVDSGLQTTAGREIYLFLENGVIVGRYDAPHDGNTVVDGSDPAAFAITIDPTTGQVSVAQYVSLNQPDHATAADGFNSYNEGVSLATGSVSIALTVKDADGDTVTKSVDVSHEITFLDDGPKVTVNVDERFSVVLDETPGVQFEDDDTTASFVRHLFDSVVNTGSDPDLTSSEKDHGAIGFAIGGHDALDVHAIFGADGPAAHNAVVYALTLNGVSGSVDSGIQTTDGKEIYLTIENGVIVGRVDTNGDHQVSTSDPAAFAIAIDDDGHVATAEYLSLKHPDPHASDETVQLTQGVVSATVTITDGDQDQATASADISSHIKFEDDVPHAYDVKPFTILDDEAQSLFPPNFGGSGDAFPSLNTLTGGAHSLFNSGADGTKSVTFAPPSDIKAIYKLDSGLAGQETLDYTTTTSGGHTVLTATGHVSGNVVFTLDVAGDGSYTFKVSEPLVHPTNSTTEENLSVKIGFTVTDGDGDQDSGSLTVKVNDDTPTVDVDRAEDSHGHDVTLASLTLDESIGVTPGDPNATSDDVPGVTAPSFLISTDPTKAIGITKTPTSDEKGTSVAELFTTDVDFGADGAKAAPTVSYTFTLKDDHGSTVSNGSATGVETNLIVTALADSPLAGLTDAQRTIYLFKEADGSIVGKIGIGGGGNVTDFVALHVVIDQSSGEPRIVVEQYLPIQHSNTNSSDESASLTFNDRDASLGVTLTVTATDGDGDVASDSKTVTLAGHDSSLIKIEDSGPTVTITATGVTVVHDETPGVQNAGDPNPSDDVAGANLPSTVLASFNAITNKGSDPDVPNKDNGAIGFALSSAPMVSVVATFGTDGAAKTNSTVLSLQIDGGNNTDSGLQTTDGQHILLRLETYNGVSMIVGRVDGNGDHSVSTSDPAAFAIEIGQDGRISVAQYLSLKNPSPGSSPSDLDEPTTTLQHVQAAVTVTDGDGDHVTKVIDISSQIQFQDDGPTLTVTAPAVINGLDFGAFVLNSNEWGQGSGTATGTNGGWTISDANSGHSGADLIANTGGGTVQLERVGDGYLGMHSSTGGYMVDLDASPHDVKISQVVTGLASGQTYDLRFEAGAPFPNLAHLEVWFGGVKVGDISPTGQMQEYTIQVVGGSGPNHDNLLEFRETGAPDNQGTYLANVSVGEIVIDETAGIQADSNEVAANSLFNAVAHQGFDPDMQPQFAEGRGAIVSVSANFGSDGPATSDATTYVVQTANSGLTDSGLQTTAGQHIILFNETYNGVSYVVGRYDSNGDHQVTSADDAAFAFTVNASTGKLSLVQYVSLHEPNTASNDEGVFLNTGSLSVTVAVKDGDGDTASKTVDVSAAIRFDDDGPTIQATTGQLPSLSVDESYLTAATNGVDGSHTGPLGSTTDHTSFAGAFTSTPGADGAKISYALAASGATSAAGVDSGLIDSATGNKVFLFLESGQIVGREGTDAAHAVGGPQVFTLSVDPNSADVSLTQLRAVHELTPGDFNEGISLNSLPNLVTLVATITDGDGDTATASIDLGAQVTFHDDGPSISAVSGSTSTEPVSYSLTAGNAIYRGADGADDHDILLTAFNGSTSSIKTVNTSQGQTGNIGVDNHSISGVGDGNVHAPDYVRIDFVTHVVTTNGQTDDYTATQHDNVTSASVSISQIQGNNNTATVFLQIQSTAATSDNSSASHDFTDDTVGSITNITVNGTSVIGTAVYNGTTVVGYVISGLHEGDTIAVTGASAFNRLIVGDYHDFAFQSDSTGHTTTIAGGHQFTLSGVQANVVTPTVFEVIEDESAGVNVAADPNPANDVDPSLVPPPPQLAGAIATNGLTAIGYAESPGTVGTLFTSNSGADAPAKVSYALSTSTANGQFTGQDSGLFATTGHAAIHLYTDTSDPSIVWGVANGDLSNGTKVFALTFDSSGHLWVAQFQAIANPIAGSDAAAYDDPVSIQPGTLFVTGTITDADGDTASAISQIPVKVTFQDDGPHAVADLNSDQSGATVLTTAATGVLSNDSAGADAPATVVGVAAGNLLTDQSANVDHQITGSLGKLTLHGDGSYTYVANPNMSGSDVFTYTIKDGDGDLSTTTLTINVTDGRPLASAGIDQVNESGLPDGSNPGVGATTAPGDHLTLSDPQGDTVTVSQVNGTAVTADHTVVHGTYGDLTINLDGSYSYTLTTADPAGVSGDDQPDVFTYTVKDSHGNSQSSTLTIDIVDDVPTIGSIVTDPVAESTLTSFANTFVPASTSGSLAITWGADNANPNVGPHDRSVAFDTSLNGVQAGLTSNGDAITYTLSNDNTLLTATATHASVTRTIFTVSIDDLVSGHYNFNLLDNIDHAAPASGAEQNDKALSFGFTATDSDGDNTHSTLTIHVTDDIPVVTGAAQSGNVSEHGLPLVQSTFGNLNIDWNADDRGTSHLEFATDGSNNLIVPTGLTSGGVALDYAVRLAANGVDQELVAFKTGESVDQPVFIVALNGLVNPAFAFQLDQPLDHTGANGSSLPLTFTVKAIDGDGDAVTQTFTVNVADDTPQANADLASVQSGDTLAMTGTVSGTGVLHNDLAGADGPATVVGVGAGNLGSEQSANVDHEITTSLGKLTLHGDGSYSYVANPNVSGSDVFTYTIKDGDGDLSTTTLTINVTDGKPLASAATDQVNEAGLPNGSNPGVGATTAAGDHLTFSDPQGDAVTVSLVNGTAVTADHTVVHGTYGDLTINLDGSYSYTLLTNDPNHTSQGTGIDGQHETFNYTVTDSHGNTQTSSLTIDIVDDVPTAVADTASDQSGAALSTSAATGVLHNDVSGADGSATVVGVGAGNLGTDQSANVDQQITTSLGKLTLHGDGSYSYVANPNVSGSDVFTYTIKDGDGDLSTTTLTINVTDGRPLAGAATDQVNEAGLPDGSNPGVGATTAPGDHLTFSDPQGDAVTVSLVNGTAVTADHTVVHGTYGDLTINLDGSYSYTLLTNDPNHTSQGTGIDGQHETFNYTVTDSHGNTQTSSLTIDIVDDVPTAVADTASDQSGAALSTSAATGVLHNDVSGADGPATVVGVGAGNLGTDQSANVDQQITTSLGKLTLHGDGSYSYVANPNVSGSDVFTYTIKDGDGDLSTTTLTINVTDGRPLAGATTDQVNEAGLPDGSNPGVGATTAPGDHLTFSDPQGDAVTVSLVNGTAVTADHTVVHGTYGDLTINLDGSYSYTLLTNDPNHTSQGTGIDGQHETFNYTVTDSHGNTQTSSLTIDIVDDVPTARADTDTTAFGAARGNVITAVGTTNSGADTLGADGASISGVQAGTSTTPITNNSGLGGLHGAFGTLYLSSNGSYVYVADANASGTDVFSYTLRDGDGDTSVTTLTITVFNGQPSLSAATATTSDAAGDDNIVNSNTDAFVVQTQSGTMSFNFGPDGANPTTPFSYSYNGGLGGATASTAVVAGQTILTLTAAAWVLTLNEATGAYTFKQTAAYDHAAGTSSATGIVNVTLTDFDGTTATKALTLTINDDTPTLGAIDHGVIANEANLTLVGKMAVDGGADHPVTASLYANNGLSPSGVTSGGNAVHYFVDSADPSTLVAYTGTDHTQNNVFTLTVDAVNGAYTFNELAPLDAFHTGQTIDGSSAFGAGPAQQQLLLHGSTQLAIVSGWDTGSGFNLSHWEQATAGSATAGISLHAINGNHNGWGVDNGNFTNGEIMRFDFGAVTDYDGPGGLSPASTASANVSSASFHFSKSSDVTYVIHYTDNTTAFDSVTSVQDLTLPTTTGTKFIDYVEFYSDNSNAKVALTSVTTADNSGSKDLSFNVTVTDHDSDTTPPGTIAITVDGDHSLTGTAGVNNDLVGGASADTLTGSNLSDTLKGNGGDDILIGNGGADNLTGGSGSDTFKYLATSDSTVAAHDVISDFSNTDVIDFSAISGITHDATHSSSAPTTVAAHSIVYFQSGADTVIYANASGATENVASADMMLVLTGINANTLASGQIHHA